MIQGPRHPDVGEGRPQELSPCCAWLLRRLEALELELQRAGFRREVFTDDRTGLVPAAGGVGATYVLAGDGTWVPLGGGGGVWGGITGTLSDQTDLQAALDDKAAAGDATASGLTLAGPSVLLGRQTGTGALQPVSLGSNLVMVDNVLDTLGLAPVWGELGGSLGDQSDLASALSAKADAADVTRYRRVDFHSTAGTNWTLTNAAATERFAANSNAPIHVADLTGCTQVRFSGRVITAGVAGTKLRLRYKLSTFSTTFGDYLQLGDTGHVEIPIDSATLVHSGWIDLAPAAATDLVFLAPTELDGNGVADPALRWLCAEFR